VLAVDELADRGCNNKALLATSFGVILAKRVHWIRLYLPVSR
jgi:hypothetical protein